MNERIKELVLQSQLVYETTDGKVYNSWEDYVDLTEYVEKFAELIVKEMCGLMEQAEDDAYHCFEPSERPTEYINWLRDWQERFEKHFGVKE